MDRILIDFLKLFKSTVEILTSRERIHETKGSKEKREETMKRILSLVQHEYKVSIVVVFTLSFNQKMSEHLNQLSSSSFCLTVAAAYSLTFTEPLHSFL